ncbi:helix-turn-helix domain-containing protein [Paucisalibacillus sp. EB02]|uniref:helix-turn-helix domain-containing protein n=1 Tax=Paucisalibacillus sp. EB02 TaxID=1347087 RepID=UPI0004AF8C03|nr:helix-turn-helix domain-containing protein [Paucisalibacillus sp. EB02]
MEPIGLGTSYVESLTSYILRLAEYHNLKVTKLVSKTFIPYVQINHLKKSFMDGSLGPRIKYVNGNSPVSLDYVLALEQLTTRNDLIYLTMNIWSGLFSDNIVGGTRKWCPKCLEEMKMKGEGVYEPLIWYIRGIQNCDIHKVKLENSCPKCGKKLQFMHKNLIIGHCQYCFAWLGDATKFDSINLSTFESFLIDSFKEMISNSQKLDVFPTNQKIGSVLKKIMDDNNFSSIRQFSDFLGVNRAVVPEWINNKRKPTTESMFKICTKLNLSIYEMFCTDIPLVDVNLQRLEEGKDRVSIKEIEAVLKNAIENNSYISLHKLSEENGFDSRTAKKNYPALCEQIISANLKHKIDMENQKKMDIKHKLETALKKDIPISLKQFSLEFGVSINEVKKYYPDLSRELINRRKNYKLEMQKQRAENIISEITKVVRYLHNSGVYPGIKTVRKIVSNPNCFIKPEYREVWRKELELLGYKNNNWPK